MSTTTSRAVIRKVMPTGPALNAVSRALFGDAREGLAPVVTDADEHQAFTRWYNESGQIGRYCVNISDGSEVDAILAEVPSGLAGRLWSEQIRASRDLTLADAYRPFDLIALTPDGPQVVAIQAFATMLRSASPLLAPVADVIDEMVPVHEVSLDDAHAAAQCLTGEGIRIPIAYMGGNTDYEDEDDFWFNDEAAPQVTTLIPWAHIDALLKAAVSMRKRTWAAPDSARVALTGLVMDLMGLLPEMAEDDQGAARGRSLDN